MKLADATKEFLAALEKGGFITEDTLHTLFETHPDTDVFFITSDGQAFFAQEPADAHSQRLSPRDVIELHREDFIDEVGDTVIVDLQPKTLAQLVDEYLKVFGTEAPEGSTVEDLVTALVAKKAEDAAKAKAAGAPKMDAKTKEAFDTPEDKRTGYQKGLITKYNKAAAAASTDNK